MCGSVGFAYYQVMVANRRRSLGAVVGLLTLVLPIAGCGPEGPAENPSASEPVRGSNVPAPSPSGTTSGVATGGLDHVVIIVEENKPAADILGNSDAPFINQLAAGSAVATNYEAVTHPSLPNYLALTSGTDAGITDDCNPPGGDCTARVRNIADLVEQSGRSWRMYAEGMPGPCGARNSGTYAVKHNPFMYYPSVTENGANCAAHVVPFTALTTDLKSASTLPNYVFISPDMCNDMHDCPVETGDVWLSRNVPEILASPAFTTQNSLLVITWDEGSEESNGVGTIFTGSAARKGYMSGARYSHYSLLHTIEASWGLTPLTGNDRAAPVMNELLK